MLMIKTWLQTASLPAMLMIKTWLQTASLPATLMIKTWLQTASLRAMLMIKTWLQTASLPATLMIKIVLTSNSFNFDDKILSFTYCNLDDQVLTSNSVTSCNFHDGAAVDFEHFIFLKLQTRFSFVLLFVWTWIHMFISYNVHWNIAISDESDLTKTFVQTKNCCINWLSVRKLMISICYKYRWIRLNQKRFKSNVA